MKILSSNTAVVFSNTIRGISTSILNAFICYGFTALNLRDDLRTFVIFFTISNLLLIMLNWGLKDYSVKLFAAEESKKIFSQLFSSRICMFFILTAILVFMPLNLSLIAFILVFSFFKSGNNTIEAFAVLNNKNLAFACVDALSIGCLIIAYFTELNFTITSIFVLIICAEILKLFIGLIIFRNQMSFHFINPLLFLKQTGNYFLVAFFSFLLSKADFYVSSIYLNSKTLINYHIYSSLIGLSQVIITAVFSRQMVIWFKSKEERFTVDMKRFSMATFGLSITALPFFYFITLYFYKFTISPITLVLVFLNLLIYSFLLLEIYLNTYQNKHRVILTGVLFSSIINIVLSFILIKYYDTIGAILANIISLFILYLYFKTRNKHEDPKINML